MADVIAHGVTDKPTEVDHASATQPPFSLTETTPADIKALASTAATSLHPVQIHDDAGQVHAPAGTSPKPGDGVGKVGDSAVSSSASASPTKEWNVAYYLAATKTLPVDGKPSDPPDKPPEHTDWGSAHKADQLRQLADATRGTSVTALVDQVREKDSVRAERDQQIRDGKLDVLDRASHNPDDYVVEHYRLKDGQMEGLGTTPSRGLSEDVKDLVSHASHDDPAKKVGLVMNVDGGGNRGVMGDSSPLQSTAQLESSIKAGLAGSGHDRLDILDMDACLMAQTGAMSTLSGAAKDIVASAETERSALDRVDGQDLSSGLKHLLSQPNISGKEWGEQIVEDAKRGVNTIHAEDGSAPSRFDTGTSTLVNLDGNNIQGLADATDKLGTVLSGALAEPASRRTISDIIDHMPRYGADGGPTESYGEQKRDLKAFTEKMQEAIAAGKLADPEGKLSTALTAAEAARKAAVTSYSGDRAGGFDKDGGVSVYLPDKTFRDVDKTLAQDTQLAQAAELLNVFAHLPTRGKGKGGDDQSKATALGVDLHVGPHLQRLDAPQREEAKPLIYAMDKLHKATTPSKRQEALLHAADEATKLLSSPLQKELIAGMDHLAADRRQRLKLDQEMVGELPGWRSFVQAMDWHS